MIKVKIKAQAWSMDIALAVIIFIAAFFVIYGIVTGKIGTGIFGLQQEAERISKEATSPDSPLSIVDGEEVNESKIKDLLEQDYSDIKQKIRVENEFCIYFEDEDGNLIRIQNASGIGTSEINVSGVGCG